MWLTHEIRDQVFQINTPTRPATLANVYLNGVDFWISEAVF